MNPIDGELVKDFRFFPLSGLQLGPWMSYLHKDHQLFLYMPSWDLLVFLAVHPEDINTLQTSDYLLLTRRVRTIQALHKRFGKNSPFTAPIARSVSGEETYRHPLSNITAPLRQLRGDYWGVAAFEVEIRNLTGLDYCNALVTYGSRIALETKLVRKKWFRSAKQFCLHYAISQSSLTTKYYSPVLSSDQSYFLTEQLYPSNSLYPRIDDISEIRRHLSHSITLETEACPGPILTISTNALMQTTPSDSEELLSIEEPETPECLEQEYRNQMLVAYFDDPVFPFLMRELLKNRGNKPLLRMYERGLPSWAMFLPSYGLPYRPWMRRMMTVVIFLVSLITMLLGFYDLYKNIPLFRETMQTTLGSLYQWLENTCVIRLSCLLGWIVYTSQTFQYLVSVPLKYAFPLVQPLIPLVLWTFEMVGMTFKQVYTCGIKVISVVIWILTIIIVAIRRVFTLPIDISWGLVSLLSNFLMDGYRAVADFIGLFRHTAGAAVSASQATSIFTDIKTFWQDVFRNILKGITSIYNFTVYFCCNLYKYKESTLMTIDQYYRIHYTQVWRTLWLFGLFALFIFLSILVYEVMYQPQDEL